MSVRWGYRVLYGLLGVLLVMWMAQALVLVLVPLEAQQPPALMYGNNNGTLRPVAVDATGDLILADTDPCASSGVPKVSVVLDVTADAIVVALTAGQTIHVCGWAATIGGTAPTYRFQSGTGVACATSVDQLSGVFAPTVGSANFMGNGGATVLKAMAAEDLCIDVGGTTPSVQGVLTYVKQ